MHVFLPAQPHSLNRYLLDMPRRRWTSTEQLNWLQEWMSAFSQAQETKDFNSFFGQVYKAWFAKYPLDQLSAQEEGEKIKGLEEAEAAGNTEKAKKIREAWWQQVSVHCHDVQQLITTHIQRIHNWFNNNTRAGSSVDDKRGVLKVTTPRQPAEWQTYLTMFYDKLKPEIDEAYDLYTLSLKPTQTPKQRVNFQAEFTMQKYASEGEEIQKRVEAFRKEQREKQIAGYKYMVPNEIQK